MRRFLTRLLTIMTVLLAPSFACAPSWAQSPLLQGGQWTARHVPAYSMSGGSQPIVQDGGAAGGGAPGVGLSELNLTAGGTGTAPFAGQGTGIDGTIFQIQDAPSLNAGGYHYLSFSANALGGGLIEYGAAGAASLLPFNLKVNGTTYQFPFTIGGIVGPSTTVSGDFACWNNAVGTLLKDCGAIGGTPGQIQYNNAGVLAGFTATGDATITPSTGAVVVSKIGSVPIALAGAFSTSGANTLTLTTTAATNVTLPTTGTLATLAGSETLSNKTLTAPVINSGNLGASTTATTQAAGDNSTKVATTAYVNATLPSGAMVAWGGSAAPAAWLLCDGSAVSRTTYAALFAVIGTTYGTGDGTTTFNLPDMRGRVAAGADGMGGTPANRLGSGSNGGITGTAVPGATGGEQAHVQALTELAAHTHTVAIVTGVNGGGGVTGGGSVLQQSGSNPTTSSAGSSAAMNITQPTLVTNWIIKI